MELEVYNKIHEFYLDNLEVLAKKQVKEKYVPPKLWRFIRHLKRRQVKLMNSNVMTENQWLFARKGNKEIQNLVFQQHEDIPSPRLHENVLYYNIIMARMEEVFKKENPRLIETSENASINHFYSKNTKIMKRGAINDVKIVPENISFTDTIEIIPHANEINTRKNMRKPSVMLLRGQNNEEESAHEQNVVNISNLRHDSNLMSNNNQAFLHLFRDNTTQNLIFIERKIDNKGKEVEFDQDFILCTVFGYKNVYVKEEDDIFEIFIPVKRKDYNEQHKFTRNLLNGYKTGSEYSQYDSSYEESPQLVSHGRAYTDTNKFSTIVPRGLIRKKTYDKSWSIEEDSEDFSKEDPYKSNKGKDWLLNIETRTNKQRSEFDRLCIDNKKNSNKSIIETIKCKNQIETFLTPDTYDEVKQSFKRTKYRFVTRKQRTTEFKYNTSSIEEKSKYSSSSSIRKRDNNLSLRRFVSDEK